MGLLHAVAVGSHIGAWLDPLHYHFPPDYVLIGLKALKPASSASFSRQLPTRKGYMIMYIINPYGTSTQTRV